jgi:hypothetical protein
MAQHLPSDLESPRGLAVRELLELRGKSFTAVMTHPGGSAKWPDSGAILVESFYLGIPPKEDHPDYPELSEAIITRNQII